MSAETTTREEILRALMLDAGEVLVEEGDYARGFWHNELSIDLEKLADGDAMGAFTVVKDIHDTAGMSMREYHEIDVNVRLPSGVTAEAIAEMCESLWERREDLTNGFSVDWDGSNWKGQWADEEDGSPNSNYDFWHRDFKEQVGDLTCREVYDLSFSENIPYVMENLRDSGYKLEEMDADAVYVALGECYTSDSDFEYTEYRSAAEEIHDRTKEEEHD